MQHLTSAWQQFVTLITCTSKFSFPKWQWNVNICSCFRQNSPFLCGNNHYIHTNIILKKSFKWPFKLFFLCFSTPFRTRKKAKNAEKKNIEKFRSDFSILAGKAMHPLDHFKFPYISSFQSLTWSYTVNLRL
jgi:hypothetical protein